jgi:dUTP pyrophosphatase
MKLNEMAQITRGSNEAAGYDLYATVTANIPPHHTVLIGTGLAMEIPKGYFGGIFARSGLATKQGIRPANCVGVIDSDYRGEVKVALHNDTDTGVDINMGDRIAQLVVIPYQEVDLEFVDSLDDTERGTGGFGSTGV